MTTHYDVVLKYDYCIKVEDALPRVYSLSYTVPRGATCFVVTSTVFVWYDDAPPNLGASNSGGVPVATRGSRPRPHSFGSLPVRP